MTDRRETGRRGSIHSLPVPPVRLFITFPLPDEVRANLLVAQAGLAGLGLPLRFTRADGLHLTLAFLGETAEVRLPALRDVMNTATRDSQSASLELRGLGVFPDARRPRVVWAGLAGDFAPLTKLHDRLRRELAAAGFPVEDRPFRPHVTLGRATVDWRPEALQTLQGRLSQPGQTQEHFGAWRAGSLDLMLSELRPEGARYTTLYTSRLREVEATP